MTDFGAKEGKYRQKSKDTESNKLSNASTQSISSRRGEYNDQERQQSTADDPSLSAISATVSEEVRFADELEQREQALKEEIEKLKGKIQSDEREALNIEDRLQEAEHETHEHAKELEKLKMKAQKREAAKLEQMKKIEAKAMKLAEEIAKMQKDEREKESDKIAQIVEHENAARRIALQCVELYETDRKLAEQELEKVEAAEKEARETIQKLLDQLGKTSQEALNKETELIGLERIAKKRASEANELVEVGKKELIALTKELQGDSQVIAVAERAYKDAVSKREAAERIFYELKAEEEIAKQELDRVMNISDSDREEYKAMEQELTSVAKEADSAELFADEQKRFHELRASEQGEMAETANEAFKQAKALLEKLVKDKEAAASKVHELHTLELLAQERAKEVEASCLAEECHPSVVNVFEHKRFEIDEKDIGVRSKLEHPNVLEYIGQAEASPWM